LSGTEDAGVLIVKPLAAAARRCVLALGLAADRANCGEGGECARRGAAQAGVPAVLISHRGLLMCVTAGAAALGKVRIAE
jgi:hypothetical protein